MYNVIHKMKDIKKYIIGMLLTIIVIVIVSNYLPKLEEKKHITQKALSYKYNRAFKILKK